MAFALVLICSTFDFDMCESLWKETNEFEIFLEFFR